MDPISFDPLSYGSLSFIRHHGSGGSLSLSILWILYPLILYLMDPISFYLMDPYPLYAIMALVDLYPYP